MKKKDKKKILIIGLTERMGGVETFIYNTTRFSDKSKYEYDYLVHGADYCVFEKEINEFYSDEKHIYFIRKYKQNPLGCIKDLLHFFRTNGKKYTYVHLQTGATSEILYIFPFCMFNKFKIISHSHNGNGYSPIINKLFQPIINWVSHKKLSCSEMASIWLFGNKHANEAVIINNGIDTEKFMYDVEKRNIIRKQYGINDEFIIGHIGRFSEQKNHEFILKILKEILKVNPNSKLILVGTGEKEEFIKDLCFKMKIEKHVIFAGSHLDVESYYSAFDVFLMPSLYEGLPIVGIEAQSEGLPCFFSKNISDKICITDRANMLSLSNTPAEWATMITNIGCTSEREKYSKIVKENGYDIRGTVKQLESIYKE